MASPLAPLTPLAALAALLAAPLQAQAPEKEPGPRATGKAYTWTSTNGIQYEYFVPKDYDPEVGANLTLILHGSNLDRRWGFANHAAGKFRPSDIVVSPDGTTSNGNGGFNSLQGSSDLERMHALHDELREQFRIRSTYLYGHSQGSFFAFYYAGAYPDDVQGVVGHASGVWIGTQGGRKNHHQAIVLMHGTADPVVPYGQSAGSLSAHFEELKYPLARLRSLDGWNHWPAAGHAEQQLAWCEGMTTDDPARLAACLETLTDVKEGLDPVAIRQVAARVLETDEVAAKARKSAESALADVDEAAEDHIAAIEKSLGKNRKRELEDEAWVGHTRLFLRHFGGVPQAIAFEKEWSRTLEAHGKAGDALARDYWRSKDSDPKKAFATGVELVSSAFLRHSTADPRILDQLDSWASDAKKLGLSKSSMKAYGASVPAFRSALEMGEKAFVKANRRYR